MSMFSPLSPPNQTCIAVQQHTECVYVREREGEREREREREAIDLMASLSNDKYKCDGTPLPDTQQP